MINVHDHSVVVSMWVGALCEDPQRALRPPPLEETPLCWLQVSVGPVHPSRTETRCSLLMVAGGSRR
ncbi:hypothetical protein EYF80_067830 [Liparis tanakae]|uniref:Uncharacterized protein n=1 Tax=Liparis tanakae TaxID=230148 RepID=A0A4Z2E023_9TELE|nr:hypothetical protein EYF80_067830 [Liparis tanakae]